MLFKSYLAALVLMLCGLHLTGSADSYRGTNITQPISMYKEVQFAVKNDREPAHSNEDNPNTQPAGKKTIPANEGKTTPQSQPTTSSNHHEAATRSLPNKDKTTTTKGTTKNSATTSHTCGGSFATILSMFTIASLMCVILL